MVQDGGLASLSIHSDVLTMAEITAEMGIQPSQGGDRGARVAPRRPGSHTYRQTVWILDAEVVSGEAPGDSCFETLRSLVEMVRGKEAALAALRASCSTEIWWYGSSDSPQGGFVLPADLLADLAPLGCDVLGTVYFDDVRMA